jgi:hypothetical protein
MKRFLRPRRDATLLVAAAIAVMAAVAGYAYFTASGSGSGAVAMGTAPAVALSSDTVGPMFPGQTKTVTVHVQNSSPGALHVGQIGGAIETNDNGTPSDPSDDCDGSWFTVAPIAAQTVPASSTVDVATTLSMTDNGASQDGCQGKTLTVDWSTGGTSAGDGGGATPHLADLTATIEGLAPNATTYRVTVTLSRPLDADTTVSFGLHGCCFISGPSEVTIPAGQLSATVHYAVYATVQGAVDAGLTAVTDFGSLQVMVPYVPVSA